MKIGRIGVLAFIFCVAYGFAEAALPKPVSMIERVTTSQSRGAYGFRSTKYNHPSWGNRWRQSMGRAPVIVSPYARGY
jgi:hypothetical protein